MYSVEYRLIKLTIYNRTKKSCCTN